MSTENPTFDIVASRRSILNRYRLGAENSANRMAAELAKTREMPMPRPQKISGIYPQLMALLDRPFPPIGETEMAAMGIYGSISDPQAMRVIDKEVMTAQQSKGLTEGQKLNREIDKHLETYAEIENNWDVLERNLAHNGGPAQAVQNQNTGRQRS